MSRKQDENFVQDANQEIHFEDCEKKQLNNSSSQSASYEGDYSSNAKDSFVQMESLNIND